MAIILIKYTAELSRGVLFGLAYFLVSPLFSAHLTITIVNQPILHAGNVRTAIGATGTRGLYKTVTTTLVEFSPLYIVCSLFGFRIADRQKQRY